MSAPITELEASLPEGSVVTDPATSDTYRHDSASFCTAGTPLAVVRPITTEQVQTVLRWASAHQVPVVPQGARTGLSGGANAIDGALMVSMVRMDRIVEIDEVDQVAVVEPGVINADLSRTVADVGLFYPPDPSSWEMSTIGGNLATNAGGLCCVKYGVTADFVRGLEVVLADGEVVRVGRRTAKGVAGYDLTRLMVGSEGTLGIITQATLALRPAPEPALTMAAVFDKTADAMTAVARIMASGLRPSMMEFLDGPSIRAVQAYRDMGLPVDAEALLITQSDRGSLAAADVAAMGAMCEELGATEVAVAGDAAESAMLTQARRLVNPAVEELGATLVDDVAVPRAHLVDLLAGMDRIAADNDVLVVCPGHIGDGNMHPTVVFDRGDAAAAERAQLAFDAIMRLALELGGTITGEHGVGLLKKTWLRRELGERSYALQQSIKSVFDPQGILNPGKVL
ncbi:FAD-binding oxidoreductase [Blastococcus capsensis]|uniref:FAD-binding oxidoreductase n=1 Tax=Blastococcus capsensis TaxID=1564163 RepID=UPI002540CE38|nr:FAD-linked oxidase C-terminal domain-containing protein [Blastococcus capsensis]MDK3255037.1 FAD-linked oxidase C-terminal domain-containing protein [Blastococcus capsensis]